MDALTSLPRLFQTVRYLRPVQIYGRLARQLPRRAAAACAAAPPVRQPREIWRPVIGRPASMLDGNRFRFLNREETLTAASDWNNTAWPRLWLYNLHYFDDLMADGSEGRREVHRALIARWIADNPPEAGTGWEPYCLSRRIVNWCQWAWRDFPLDDEVCRSLVEQARSLALQLETHLLGNHLIANAKALVFAGTFFEGVEADRWLATGVKYLRREIREQVLADGGHFERSPMYHAIILEDLLDVLHLATLFPGRLGGDLVRELCDVCGGMVAWLLRLSHPDGDIAFFNDSSFGVARRPHVLAAYAEGLRCPVPPAVAPVVRLQSSGYVRMETGPAVVVADVGEIGPDYLPGHAHADNLSFEMSLNGQRVLVNSGTSTYAVSEERRRQRGTAAHNTVVVDHADSSDVWSSFRVGRRARPGPVALRERNGSIELTASHDGYRRLSGRLLHHRSWRLSDSMLVIEDRLTGDYEHANSRWHLHPATSLHQIDRQRVEIRIRGLSVRVQFDDCTICIHDTVWSPEFGKSVPSVVIDATLDGRVCRSEWRWSAVESFE